MSITANNTTQNNKEILFPRRMNSHIFGTEIANTEVLFLITVRNQNMEESTVSSSWVIHEMAWEIVMQFRFPKWQEGR
jgi:hypothetical protein